MRIRDYLAIFLVVQVAACGGGSSDNDAATPSVTQNAPDPAMVPVVFVSAPGDASDESVSDSQDQADIVSAVVMTDEAGTPAAQGQGARQALPRSCPSHS